MYAYAVVYVCSFIFYVLILFENYLKLNKKKKNFFLKIIYEMIVK